MSSLKCWMSKVEKQDKISKQDLSEIFSKLDGHDNAIRAQELSRVMSRIKYLASQGKISLVDWITIKLDLEPESTSSFSDTASVDDDSWKMAEKLTIDFMQDNNEKCKCPDCLARYVHHRRYGWR